MKLLWPVADHSPPFIAEVKNGWSCSSTPPIYTWRGQGQEQGIGLIYLLRDCMWGVAVN